MPSSVRVHAANVPGLAHCCRNPKFAARLRAGSKAIWRRLELLAADLLGPRFRQTDAPGLNAVATNQVEDRALGSHGLGLAQDVKNVVWPDRLPVAGADVHSDQN